MPRPSKNTGRLCVKNSLEIFKHPIFFVFTILLILSTVANHQQLNREAPSYESLLYFPASSTVKTYALGFDHAMAHILWMRTLSYFGDHFATDRDYKYLAHMLDITTQLNPDYKAAYYMSGVILPWMTKESRSSERLLVRAMIHMPEQGIWPYYLGLNQFLFKDDRRLAAHYLDRSIRKGFINRLSAGLASKLRAESGNLESAKEYVLQILSLRQDKNMAAFLYNELKKIETELIIRQLEGSISESGATSSIQTIEDIRKLNIDIPDKLPDGGVISINHTGMLFSTRTPARYKLHDLHKSRAPHRHPRS